MEFLDLIQFFILQIFISSSIFMSDPAAVSVSKTLSTFYDLEESRRGKHK